ncbi:MAG: hypothetical protein ABIH18_07480 [Candidatus Omnitrophota bacterium]
MEKKVKFAIIGLVGLLLVSFVIVLQITNSKQILENEIDKLSTDNANFSKEINSFSSERRRLQDRIDSMNSELSRLGREKEDLSSKCDLLEKAKDGLIEKLKSAGQAKVIQPVQQTVQQPYTLQKEDAYWAGVLKVKTDLEFQLDNLRAQLKGLGTDNEKLQREKSMLQLDITNLTRDKDTLNHQLEYNQKLMDSISAELVREKNNKMQQQDELKVLKNENTLLTRQVKNLTSSKVNLEKKLYKMEGKNKDLENKLTEMDTVLKEKMYLVENIKRQLISAQKSMEQGLGETKNTVELSPIVVKPQSSTQNERPVFSKPLAPIGKVLSINRDNNFVIVDIGNNSGIRLGDTFQVFRGNSSIGRIEVIRIRDSVAACDIKQESTLISEGDIIK